MRIFALVSICCSAAVLGGCRKAERRAADTAAMVEVPAAPAPGAAVAALTPKDVAGKWNMRATNEASDSTLVVFVLNATPDLTGSTLVFKNRPPVPVHVVIAGDSVVTDAGPYESTLRKGVQVTTHGVNRLQNGKLVGTTMARYRSSGADSVRRFRVEGTRAQ
ncbi:MAG: hypothetical protein ACJ79S_19295 [Gemmatimonadaceae bacterium]